MNNQNLVQNFFGGQNVEIQIGDFLISLVLAAVLSYLISIIYIKYGESLSNRRAFARNFVLLALTTTLIITIVKSSLALSLGLVGALSIVRFRAAIKEPEELAYLFLTISVGLGMGANQILITVSATILILIIIILRGIFQKKSIHQNMNLIISAKKTKKITLDKIVSTLSSTFDNVSLKRLDEGPLSFEAAFIVEFDDYIQFSKAKREIDKISKKINITFLDNKGIY